MVRCRSVTRKGQTAELNPGAGVSPARERQPGFGGWGCNAPTLPMARAIEVSGAGVSPARDRQPDKYSVRGVPPSKGEAAEYRAFPLPQKEVGSKQAKDRCRSVTRKG